LIPAEKVYLTGDLNQSKIEKKQQYILEHKNTPKPK